MTEPWEDYQPAASKMPVEIPKVAPAAPVADGLAEGVDEQMRQRIFEMEAHL